MRMDSTRSLDPRKLASWLQSRGSHEKDAQIELNKRNKKEVKKRKRRPWNQGCRDPSMSWHKKRNYYCVIADAIEKKSKAVQMRLCTWSGYRVSGCILYRKRRYYKHSQPWILWCSVFIVNKYGKSVFLIGHEMLYCINVIKLRFLNSRCKSVALTCK